jgi:mevalonate kinase
VRNHSDIFYAKILLFGEYSVLLNSMGLSIPYSHFSGEFSFIGENKYTDLTFAKCSNLELRKFCNYLEKEKSTFESFLKIEAFSKDIKEGLYFESSIPESYGLGSSGALCAAIYKRYSCDSFSENESISGDRIVDLKKKLSLLESGFHGKSSGLDPLNSYMKSPLWIKSKNEIEQVSLPGKKFNNNSAIFLVDTKQTGNTAPLVDNFMQKCTCPEYKSKMENELIPLNNECILNFTEGKIDEFFGSVKKLSAFQMHNFKEMIPAGFESLWCDGIETQDFYLKLCGSGGGGFLLGFTHKYLQTEAFFQQKGYNIIPVYHQAH